MAKHAGGRPTKYKPEYCDQLIEMFSIKPYQIHSSFDKDGNESQKVFPNHFPTLARFAANIDVCRDTLYEWSIAQDDEGNLVYPEFSCAYKKAKHLQEANLVEGTMSGAYQQAFAIFTAKNILGWRDKTETEISGSGLAINIDLGDSQ